MKSTNSTATILGGACAVAVVYKYLDNQSNIIATQAKLVALLSATTFALTNL